MEDSTNRCNAYKSIIWVTAPEDEGRQLHSELIIALSGVESQQGTELYIHNSSLFDFRYVTKVKDYFDILTNLNKNVAKPSLIAIPFKKEDLVIIDVYMAKLARVWTCEDTMYLNCPSPAELGINHSIAKNFDYIISDRDITNSIVKIVRGAPKGIYY
jgi:hypothetical protein